MLKSFIRLSALLCTTLALLTPGVTAQRSAEGQEFVFPAPRPGDVPARSNLTTSPAPSATGTSGSSQVADGVTFVLIPPRRPSNAPTPLPMGVGAPLSGSSPETVSGGQATASRQPATPPTLPAGCFNQLDSLNVIYVKVADIDGPGECGLTDGVEVSAFNQVRLLPPARMTCQVASATAQWLRNSVVPEALQRFGQPVVDVRQVSTYSCRSRPSGRLSEHGFGNAIDISGVVLANGNTISISPDWQNGGRKGRFLRAIAQSSCLYFSTVLTPLSDAAHQDHFHLDKGSWVSCGA